MILKNQSTEVDVKGLKPSRVLKMHLSIEDVLVHSVSE
jgi:hypothetical protein